MESPIHCDVDNVNFEWPVDEPTNEGFSNRDGGGARTSVGTPDFGQVLDKAGREVKSSAGLKVTPFAK